MVGLMMACGDTSSSSEEYDCCLNEAYYACDTSEEFSSCNLNDGASECDRDSSKDDQC
jgi:hypothetical protein